MPEKKAPNLGLSEGWVTGENGWGGPMTENMVKIDTLLHGAVQSITLAQPPQTALEGDRFICAPNSVQAWSGHDLEVAVKIEGQWKFFKPSYGWQFRVKTLDDKLVWFDGKAWLDAGTGAPVDQTGPPAQNHYLQYGCSAMFKPNPGERIMFIPNLQPAILPPNAQGSAAILMQPLVEDDVIITIERALVKVGTITFPKDGVNGVFSVATSTVFALGDALSLLCPNEIPDSFQNIGINLRLTLLG